MALAPIPPRGTFRRAKSRGTLYTPAASSGATAMVMRHVSLLLSLLGAAHAQDDAPVTCEQCVAIQEGIHRTINHNISALETRATSGTQTTERIEIGQLIWRMCESESWKEQRHHDELTAACRSFAKVHVDVATRYWQEKSSDEYKDHVLGLQARPALPSANDETTAFIV